MQKAIWIVLVAVLGLASCTGNRAAVDPVKQAATDDSIIQAYIKQHHIAATKDSSGLYYQVLKQGTGANATGGSTVKVTYEGTLTDDKQFDKSEKPIEFPLTNVIAGWTKGLTLVKPGGKILLIIPSALGYGPQSAGEIPENSVLVFKVDLLEVK
ncbi:FKBP-type peptidyl-prolyl cis-trans isomerase [Mucilaginibacter sp. PPCGB 2223]|uniref:FKBP-type peptidyl-prolyl cis-trans isomerase n=1 Tax=Mucilaginibacter sp. PPCGB 2223 TaxID=1886027 RepID=UPI001C307ADA|nr:FKBP-type peptidyl-prolyl cis-trans isomerase [Mucilaginibacter sp. PPCGB 2223]